RGNVALFAGALRDLSQALGVAELSHEHLVSLPLLWDWWDVERATLGGPRTPLGQLAKRELLSHRGKQREGRAEEGHHPMVGRVEAQQMLLEAGEPLRRAPSA